MRPSARTSQTGVVQRIRTFLFGGACELENREVGLRIADAVDAAMGRPEGTSRGLITPVADRAGHDARYALDSSLAKRELDWEPRVKFEDALGRVVRERVGRRSS